MNKVAFAFCWVVLGVTFASADTMPMNASGLKWGPAPSVFPKGAQVAVLSGDPFKDGPYVLRMKMPKGYKFPAHNHPTPGVCFHRYFRQFPYWYGRQTRREKGIELHAGGYGEALRK